MNVEELQELAQVVVADLQGMDLLTVLDQLHTALAGQVADPNAQGPVIEVRDNLFERLRAGAIAEFNPRWREVMDDLGIGFLLPERMLDTLTASFGSNQTTPQAIQQEVADLVTQTREAQTRLTELLTVLEYLGFSSTALGPGEYEAAVLIPRAEVENSLAGLGREFQNLETLIRPFVEITAGSPPPVELRAIGSSQFLALIAMAPPAALLLSKAIDGVLSVYERVLKIRQLRQQLAESGLPEATVDTIQQNATDMLAAEIPAVVEGVLDLAQRLPQDGRSHEISTALTRSVSGIAERVDHGFWMTVRAGPPPEGAEDEGEEAPDGGDAAQLTLARIRELVVQNQQRATYQELAGEPILRELPSPLPPSEPESSGP